MSDDIDTLLRDLSYIESGWHRHENSETGAVAIFPETAEDAEDWEARALEMHAAQWIIVPEVKPAENTLAARVVRAD